MPKVSATTTPAKSVTRPAGCPLFLHQTGRWCKKIKGKLHYFGRDLDAALAKWADQGEDLLAGRLPKVQADSDGLTCRVLANTFLTAKLHRVESGEITQRTFDDYKGTCERVLAAFGKARLVTDLTAHDFELLRAKLAKTRGPVALANEIQRVRSLFKYAYDEAMIEAPVRHGQAFKKPSKSVMRKTRAAKGKRLLSAESLRDAIDAASPQLRAMLLLAVNTGCGNSDCANLTLDALNLQRGWLDYPRIKTGVQRRAPLWPQTVQALQEAIDTRPAPKDPADARLVFITKYGRPWKAAKAGCPISAECRKVFRSVGIERGSFYWCRHQFCTVGAGGGDRDAVEHVMGHVAHDRDMHHAYLEEMADERLVSVVERVRVWLFGAEKPKRKRATKQKPPALRVVAV